MGKLSAQLPASLQVGKDGVSPIVKVGEIAGGHRITIIDAQGEITFDVPDGKNGKSAYDYALEAGYTGDSVTFAQALLEALVRPALLYTEQALTPEQKAQAQTNIGVTETIAQATATVEQFFVDQDFPSKAYVYEEAERVAKNVVSKEIGDISTALSETVKSVNGQTPDENGEVTIPTGITKTLLWENASPTSTFAPQFIGVNLTTYQEVEIEFVSINASSTQALLRTSMSISVAAGLAYRGIATYADPPNGIVSRVFIWTPARYALQFLAAYHNGATISNAYLIPYKVYGIKGVQ